MNGAPFGQAQKNMFSKTGSAIGGKKSDIVTSRSEKRAAGIAELDMRRVA